MLLQVGEKIAEHSPQGFATSANVLTVTVQQEETWGFGYQILTVTEQQEVTLGFRYEILTVTVQQEET